MPCEEKGKKKQSEKILRALRWPDSGRIDSQIRADRLILANRFFRFPELNRSGQSTVGGPKWTKIDLFRSKWTILVHFGLANTKIPVRNKAILTKMAVLTILDHFGPVRFPTVLRRLLRTEPLFANRASRAQKLRIAGLRRFARIACTL